MKIGTRFIGAGTCEFIVWAPLHESVSLHIVSPAESEIPMLKTEDGYWKTVVEDIKPGARYWYRPGNRQERPDPVSAFQPDGVHGPSSLVDHATFRWQDDGWQGIPLAKMIMYELHVGTFTPEGTFDAVINRLDDLRGLGINAIDIMPVTQFPGGRNWGYDGAYPFAVQNSYGAADGLKRLVEACHLHGMAVILDVVYNHLGPEGNYLAEFGPYFTDKYHTPWGKAVNFDDAYCDGVRNYFIENALCWFEHYHIDGLRLDAIHGIFDTGAKHILDEMSERVQEFSGRVGRQFYLIAESDLNDARVIRSRTKGGYEVDAQWSDDFHHAVHTLFTGERNGYYQDFGEPEQLVKALKEGFVYSWVYSKYRKRHHGSSSADIPADRFVVFIQNHDQVGNRMMGDRLGQIVSFEAAKLAAATLLTSPYIPLLFMGEEYAEDNPFQYFVSHSDRDLIEAVRRGRAEEFKSFGWEQAPPDPQSEETFERSRPDWTKRNQGRHRTMLELYRTLISLRTDIPALSHLSKQDTVVSHVKQTSIITMRRTHRESQVFCVMNFSEREAEFLPTGLTGRWCKRLDTADTAWLGPGSDVPEIINPAEKIRLKPYAFVLYERQDN
jgi:maltooligosyltrehalose trehalohydrolase